LEFTKLLRNFAGEGSEYGLVCHQRKPAVQDGGKRNGKPTGKTA
jgi:hypothetical protein